MAGVESVNKLPTSPKANAHRTSIYIEQAYLSDISAYTKFETHVLISTLNCSLRQFVSYKQFRNPNSISFFQSLITSFSLIDGWKGKGMQSF